MPFNLIRTLPVHRYAYYLFLGLLGSYSMMLSAEPLLFDDGRLKNRGLDAGLSHYFSHAARFSPGEYPVSWVINGRNKRQLMTRFNAQGEPCITPETSRNLGLAYEFNQGCLDYQTLYPAAQLTADPYKNQISITVPTSALTPESILLRKDIIQGGTSGLLNYNLQSSTTVQSGKHETYQLGLFESGLNLNDWLLRSRHTVSYSDGTRRSQRLYTYVQKTFQSLQQTFQAGEIYARQTLLAIPGLTGLQLFPDSALRPARSGVSVQGIARSAQARVEVYQNGQLIEATQVPEGPFSLDNISMLSTQFPLDVKVTEQDGQLTTFSVPVTALQTPADAPLYGSVALGKVRETVASDESAPWLITGSQGMRISRQATLSGSALASAQYQSAAASLSFIPIPAWSLSLQTTMAQEQYTHHAGSKESLSLRYQLNPSASIQAAWTTTSAGFRELSDAVNHTTSTANSYYNVGGNWAHEYLGLFSLSYSTSSAHDHAATPKSWYASWSKNWRWAGHGQINLSATWQRVSGSRTSTQRDDDVFYIRLGLPLGHDRVNLSLRRQGSRTYNDVQTSGQWDDMSYSLSAGRDWQNAQNTISGSFGQNLHYAQMSGYASQTANYWGYGGSLSGGISVNQEGILFSPYAIQESYGALSLNSPLSGIKVSTPQGPVWTDYRGKALVPGLTPWQPSRLNIDVKTLPRHVDLTNGAAELTVSRGAVAFTQFRVSDTRRVLMTVRRTDGKLLSKGKGIVDSDGQYVTNSLEKGLVFFSNLQPGESFFVGDDNGSPMCQLQYSLPPTPPQDGLYEELTGVCE